MHRLITPIFALASRHAGSLADTLKKPGLDKLAAAQQAAPSASFRAFLDAGRQGRPQLKPAIAAYEQGAARRRRPHQHRRLLGLYNRLHNQKAVIAALDAMVAIPTVRDDKIPPHESQADHRVRHAGRRHGQGLRPAVPQRRQPHLRGQAAGPRAAERVRHPDACRRRAGGGRRMGARRRHAARPLQADARGRLRSTAAAPSTTRARSPRCCTR